MSAREERPRDPGRPARIVAAARDIARERGVGSVTHRTVAERAGVPLGSTTYYFTSIDDLLAHAIELDIADFEHRLATALPTDSVGTGSADDLVSFLCAEAEHTDSLIDEYSLYLAAFSRPALRPLALRWTQVSIRAYTNHVPEAAATAIAMLFDGYAVRTTFAGTNQFPNATELARQLTRLATRSAGDPGD